MGDWRDLEVNWAIYLALRSRVSFFSRMVYW